MTNEKKTVGQQVLENQITETGTYNALELAGASLSTFENSVIEAVERGIKEWPSTTLYVVVTHLLERLLVNTIRNKFQVRRSAPTPEQSQSVFKYDHQREEITCLWSLPDKETCLSYHLNKESVDPSDYDILRQIESYYDGTLLKLVKKLNNEI